MKNCPECGAPSPVFDTRDLPFTYKGQITTIPAVSGFYCLSCGELTLLRDAVNRYIRLIGEFQRKVNSTLAD